MKVLHFPANIGGQAALLSRGERRLGLSSDVVVVGPHFRSADEIDKHYPVDGQYPARDLVGRSIFGLRAPFRYDVLHAYFGRTLLEFDGIPGEQYLRFADLRLAKRLGKPVFLTFQGCDIRLAAQTFKDEDESACMPDRCGLYAACVDVHDIDRRKMMDTLRPLADRVFLLNPDLRRSWPGGEFLPYALDVQNHAVLPSRSGGPIRIVHAPSAPSMKGTPAIVEAVNALKSEFDIEFEIVSRQSHSEALKRFAEFDLAIDQCYLGWYGAFAVEMMARGKPVLAYLRKSDLGSIPQAMRDEMPVMDLRPDQLVTDLRHALEQRSRYADIGRNSARFARRWHDAQTIAGAVSACYRDPQAPLDLAAFMRPDAVINAEISSQAG